MMMSGRKDKLYTTSWACFQHIWREGGIKLVYKGAGMNSIRAIGRCTLDRQRCRPMIARS